MSRKRSRKHASAKSPALPRKARSTRSWKTSTCRAALVGPICQDTGTPIFYVWYPEGWSQRKLREQITQAVQIATEKSYLRPNAVEAISGKNSGDNTGVDFPTIHFEEWEHDYAQASG